VRDFAECVHSFSQRENLLARGPSEHRSASRYRRDEQIVIGAAGSRVQQNAPLSSAVGLKLGADRHVGVIGVVDDHQIELEFAARLCFDPLGTN
jgi:hypothetical protein